MPGVTATSSGTTTNTSLVCNGYLENWYYSQVNSTKPWMDNTVGFPAWVQLTFPSAQTINQVVVYASPPWQSQSSLLQYDLQYWNGSSWVTLQSVNEPANTWPVYTPFTRTTVDSFYSDRWVFLHSFSPVSTTAVRLNVYNTTWGGGATQLVQLAGGQTGVQQMVIRELKVFSPNSTPTIHNYEVEDLAVPNFQSQSGGSYACLGGDSNLSNGDGVILYSNNIGDYITFTLPNVPAGLYNVTVGVKETNSRGQFQLEGSKSGGATYANIGGVIDEYNANTTYAAINVGTWQPGTTGGKWFRFNVVGKNANSTSGTYPYEIAIDYIKLTPQ
jgi:hypothetical protein